MGHGDAYNEEHKLLGMCTKLLTDLEKVKSDNTMTAEVKGDMRKLAFQLTIEHETQERAEKALQRITQLQQEIIAAESTLQQLEKQFHPYRLQLEKFGKEGYLGQVDQMLATVNEATKLVERLKNAEETIEKLLKMTREQVKKARDEV